MTELYAIALSCLTPTYSTNTPDVRKLQYDSRGLSDGTEEDCQHSGLLFDPARPQPLLLTSHLATGSEAMEDEEVDENACRRTCNLHSTPEEVLSTFGPYIGRLSRNTNYDCFDQVAAYAGGESPTQVHTESVRESLGLTIGIPATSLMQIQIARHYGLGLIVIDLLDQRIKYCCTGTEECILYLRQQQCHASPFCQTGDISSATHTHTQASVKALLVELKLSMAWTEVNDEEISTGEAEETGVDGVKPTIPKFSDVAGDSSPILTVRDHTTIVPFPPDAYPAGEYRVVRVRHSTEEIDPWRHTRTPHRAVETIYRLPSRLRTPPQRLALSKCRGRYKR